MTDTATQVPRNTTAQEDEDTLRRSLILALSDAMAQPKVPASVLEAARRVVADMAEERRWQADRDSAAASEPKAPIMPAIALTRLPFPVRERQSAPTLSPTEADLDFDHGRFVAG